jgi:hypothetical protein
MNVPGVVKGKGRKRLCLRQKNMPEELGVGTIAEWSVPSSGIKRRFQLLCF